MSDPKLSTDPRTVTVRTGPAALGQFFEAFVEAPGGTEIRVSVGESETDGLAVVLEIGEVGAAVPFELVPNLLQRIGEMGESACACATCARAAALFGNLAEQLLTVLVGAGLVEVQRH